MKNNIRTVEAAMHELVRDLECCETNDEFIITPNVATDIRIVIDAVDNLRAVNAEMVEALAAFFREQDSPTSTDGFELNRGRADSWVNLRAVFAKHHG